MEYLIRLDVLITLTVPQTSSSAVFFFSKTRHKVLNQVGIFRCYVPDSRLLIRGIKKYNLRAVHSISFKIAIPKQNIICSLLYFLLCLTLVRKFSVEKKISQIPQERNFKQRNIALWEKNMLRLGSVTWCSIRVTGV